MAEAEPPVETAYEAVELAQHGVGSRQNGAVTMTHTPALTVPVHLLQELDQDATVVGLATIGGQQRPEWRVSVESTRPAVDRG